MATQLGSSLKQGTPKGPPINVRVRAFKDQSGTVDYDYDWDFGGPPKTGKIDVPQGTPPTDIKFHLKDETSLNLSFYPAPADAFWVAIAPNCPMQSGDAGEFNLKSPPSSSSNNLLTVHDKNKTACDLKYALRFDGDPYTDSNGTHPPYKYDPDLRNGGGGRISSSSAALIGAAAVAVIAFTAVVWLIR
jgi:hypothetical protein